MRLEITVTDSNGDDVALGFDVFEDWDEAGHFVQVDFDDFDFETQAYKMWVHGEALKVYQEYNDDVKVDRHLSSII